MKTNISKRVKVAVAAALLTLVAAAGANAGPAGKSGPFDRPPAPEGAPNVVNPDPAGKSGPFDRPAGKSGPFDKSAAADFLFTLADGSVLKVSADGTLQDASAKLADGKLKTKSGVELTIEKGRVSAAQSKLLADDGRELVIAK